jgi:hypothetical protein
MHRDSLKTPSPYKVPLLMSALGGILIGLGASLDGLILWLSPYTSIEPFYLFLIRLTTVSIGVFVFGSALYFMSYNVNKARILEHPRKLLIKAKRVKAKTEKAEEAYMAAWNTRPWEMHEFYARVTKATDIAARAIVNKAIEKMKKNGYDVKKVRNQLMKALEEYRKGTDEGIKEGGKLIKEAIKTAEELKKGEMMAESSAKKAEEILRKIKAKEYANHKKEIDEAEELLKMSRELLKKEDFKTALVLAKEAQKKAEEMKDLEERVKRYIRKTEMIMDKLENELMLSPVDPKYSEVTDIYRTAKLMSERKLNDIALVLVKEAKLEAEKLLPTEELTPWDYVCPICFDYICPDEHCGLSISPSPLKEDTCRYVCECGAHYHLCCIDHTPDFKCVYCGRPLKTPHSAATK